MNAYNHLLRQRIYNLVNAKNLTDDHVIEGICQFLNIKYPLEEPKRFEYRLFGKTDNEILRALEFYDKHSEEVVQDDLTLSEAVETVYDIQRKYASSGIDKKWVEIQLKSYEAIGLIKFKEATEKDNVIIEARKFAAEYVEYDFKNPANTISKMSRIIAGLLNMMKDDK